MAGSFFDVLAYALMGKTAAWLGHPSPAVGCSWSCCFHESSAGQATSSSQLGRANLLHRSWWPMGPGNHTSFVRALPQAQGQNIPVSLKSHAMFRQCLARWSAEITHAASFIRGGFKMNFICTNAPAREMSTCIAFKFVHSALDYESVAELNPSRANFLFSYPARTAQNVSN